MVKNTERGENPLLVVLDGGAFMGCVEPGFLGYLADQKVNVSYYAGISIGSLIATLVSNNRSQADMREFMLKHFAKGLPLSVVPPLSDLRRLLFGGVLDQVPLMRRLVKELDLSPQPNLRIVAFDLLGRKPYVFEGTNYDLAIALAASCSPYPIIRPVHYVDEKGQELMLVDACVYLAHKRIFSERTIIARIFNIKLRNPQEDEEAVMIGYPWGKIIRRVTPQEYDKYWQYGYARAADGLSALVRHGKLPLLSKAKISSRNFNEEKESANV